VPYKGKNKPEPQKEANRTHAKLRAPGERANAQFKTWNIVDKLRCCPWQAGRPAKAIHALQLRDAQRGWKRLSARYACSSVMTPAHIEPSANAPCTRSTVGVLPFRSGAEWLIASVAAVGSAWQEATAAGRALAWITLLLLARNSRHAASYAPRRSHSLLECHDAHVGNVQ
jgi:hypothetical protein